MMDVCDDEASGKKRAVLKNNAACFCHLYKHHLYLYPHRLKLNESSDDCSCLIKMNHSHR